MDKFSLDYGHLSDSLEESGRKQFRLDDVKDRIEKVAFNVVRFRDNSDIDDLWEVRETNDGPVIVALYDDDGRKADGDWSAVSDVKTASVHVYYKGDPLVRIAAKDLNIPADEVRMLARWLPDKLATDEGTQAFVLSYAGPQGLESIKSQYPELRKVAQASRRVPVINKPVHDLKKVANAIKQSDIADIARKIKEHAGDM